MGSLGTQAKYQLRQLRPFYKWKSSATRLKDSIEDAQCAQYSMETKEIRLNDFA